MKSKVILRSLAGRQIVQYPILVLLYIYLLIPNSFAANPDGDLRIEIIAGYNLIVDSNAESPSSYAPSSFYIGAKVCNDGANDMTNVFALVGDHTAGTPGVYPVETTDEAALGYSYSGDFSLTHVADLSDATRYIGILPAGECKTQYWLVTYPSLDNSGNAVFGASRTPDDDLAMDFDVWATADDGGSPLEASVTKTVTCRNEISAASNKIWPNGDNKVPDEYKTAIQDSLGWDVLAVAGGSTVYPGEEPLTMSGIWYDMGNINMGFDNDGDFVPDYNAWLQPVGDPSLIDPNCFRLVRTFGIIIISKKSGGYYVENFDNKLYFQNLPENTGGVGLVYYEYVSLDGPCTSNLSPYQEVASGSDNEKFNADFGLSAQMEMSSLTASLTLDKSVSPSVLTTLPATVTFTLAFSNAVDRVIGQPDYGVPIVVSESVPAGAEYVSGSAASGNTLPSGVSGYTILYSTDNGSTWETTEPSPASDVTDIQWWLDDALPGLGSGNVTFQLTFPSSYSNPIAVDTASLSIGHSTPFAQDTAQNLFPGINTISGSVYQDDAGTTGTAWNQLFDGDESGMANVTVTLYYDSNGDGTIGTGDFVWGTTATDGSGNYSFTDLPDGNYIVEVNSSDPDITTGYVESSSTSSAIDLDSGHASGSAVDQTDVDFGFGPPVSITKYLTTDNPAYEGDTLTFVLRVSNRSDIGLDVTPVVDTFDADRLEFLYAIPQETSVSTGNTSPHSNTGIINWSSIGTVPGNGENSSQNLPSILGRWDFEEGTGTNAADGSGNNLDGTLVNGPTWTAGQDGLYGIDFDGVDDYIRKTNYNFNLGSRFAIAFWAKTEALTSNAAYVCNSVSGVTVAGEWFAISDPVNGLGFVYNPSDGNQTSILSGYEVDDGQWHHIVFNYNGSTIDFFVDGSSVYSQAASINVVSVATLDILFGNNIPAATGNEFDGALDQVIVFDSTLTSTQINRLMERGTIEEISGQEVTVAFRAKDQTVTTDTTVNCGVVTGATFLDGRAANDDMDQSVAIIRNTGSISGYVWNDSDGLGWEGTSGLDAGDDSLSNVRIVLYECQGLGGGGSCSSGYATDTTYTDGNGYYEFTRLREGYYYYVTVLSGDIPGTVTGTADPDDDGINSGNGGVCSGGNACDNEWDRWHQIGTDSWNGSTFDWTNVSFGFAVPPALFGTIWEDIDGDGVQDPGEEGIAGVTVNLSGGATAVTDENGYYSFGNLSATSYTLTVSTGTLPSVGGSWSQTAETDGTVNNSITYTLTSGEVSGSHDFGFHPTGAADIGDYLYFDWNGDGDQDPEDEGIPNIDISLYRDVNGNGVRDDADIFLETTSTDANGAYLFSNYPQGDYLVIVDENDAQFPNASQTGDPEEAGTCTTCDAVSSVSLDGTTDNLAVDFGYQPTGTANIGDLVWYDANGNSNQSGVAETGIAGVKVVLYADLNGDGTYVKVDSIDTDADGSYSFSILPNGNYKVVVDSTDAQIPVDAVGNTYESTTSNSYEVILTNGFVSSINGSGCTDCDYNLDFGFAPLGSIGDRIFWDANGNGTQDWDEEGASGVTVYLCAGDVGTCDSGTALYTTTTSDGTDGNPVGYYKFTGLDPGTYTVGVETGSGPLAGISQTADPNSDGLACDDPLIITYELETCDDLYSVTVNYGTNVSGADFGYQPTGVIGDFVWFDQNGDGVQDAGEAGHAGDTLWLCNAPGPCTGATAIDTAITDFDGAYFFADIPDGTYAITLEVPGTMSVTSGSGSVGSSSVEVVLSSGAVTSIGGSGCSDCGLDIDFGLELSGAYSISGSVCLDDGSLDGVCTGLGGETSLGSITLNIFNSSGEYMGSTATDGSGNYIFSNLPADTYTISVNTTLPPLDMTSLTTDNADVPAGGTVTETETSSYLTIPVSSSVTDADLAFELNADIDYGDLSSTYQGISELSYNGARHILEATPTLYLGTLPPDSESDVTFSSNASADGPEDDGSSFATVGTWEDGTAADGKGGDVTITVTGTGWLIGWVDFNVDGDFSDPGEMIVSTAVTSGTQNYTFDVPTGTFNGIPKDLFARLRVFESKPAIPATAFTGSTYGGEVEDYFFRAGVFFPVEWLDFKVEQKGVDAVLTWSTAQELNSDYFDVERSLDQTTFEMIGTVQAAGTTTEISEYTYTDPIITAQSNPVLFYRLRQVDLDGKFDYSNVVELQMVKTEQVLLLVFPNPADERITIRYIFTGDKTGSRGLRILDALGKNMYEKGIMNDVSEGEVQLSTSTWAEGYYFIQLFSEGNSDVFKLEVR